MSTRGPARLRVIDGARASRPGGGADGVRGTSPEPPLARIGSSPDLARDATPTAAAAPRDRAAGGGPSPDLAQLEDGQLVVLGARGDQRALEVLYRRHAAFAIHLAARIEGSSRDVEDVAHDAFLKAFTHLGDLADPRSFRSWLGSIVVHAVRSRMRRTRLMNVLGITNLFGRAAEPVDLDAIASSDASPLVRAQLAQVYALLRTLPTDERIAWTLRAIEGHDLETVARLTSCSLATAKRRISRAQKALDELFVPPQNEGEDAPAPAPAAAALDRAPTRDASPRNRR
jgi:RNA polymerase sigma-70 factor (ECF subfamily)